MSEVKHTPGPWKKSRIGFCSFIYSDDQPNIAAVHSNDSVEGQANADLIIAAPALLAALKLYISCRDSGRLGEENDAVEYAIAKAEGR